MDDEQKLYSVNELAVELGITPRTIRFYEQSGLIVCRRVGSNRVLDRRDRARLMLILRGKRLGFSLGHIREFLDLYEADRSQVEQIRLLLNFTRLRIADLEAQQRDLNQTLGELRGIETQAAEALMARGQAANPLPPNQPPKEGD